MQQTWFLEGVAADGSSVAHELADWPYRVGRDPSNQLVIEARGLSRRHAELLPADDGRLRLTDLGSTNGTFVNRERIDGTVVLDEGDVIHFGHAEFRLGTDTHTRIVASRIDNERTQMVARDRTLPEHFVREERQFMALLAGDGLTAAAQPIVDARSGDILAYELLGRSNHPTLPRSPAHLFHMAEVLHRAAELSEAFRSYGVREMTPRLRGRRLFVNIHPDETFSDALIGALTAVRAQPDAPTLVAEVHESAIVDLPRMRELAVRLASIGVPFAYDDFGSGQARINELAEVPPDYVKFDMSLIRDLDTATAHRRNWVRELARLVTEGGSVPLAEGVETEGEASICRDMGFQLIQGYLTGRPVPVADV